MSDFGVILLRTGTAVMRAHKLLGEAAVAARLVPVPREFSTACGVALRLAWTDCAPAHELLRGAGLEVAGVHRLACTPDVTRPAGTATPASSPSP